MPTSRIHFDEEMARIFHDVLAMGIRVEEDLGRAILAFRTRDANLAREVKLGDKEVNAMQVRLEDHTASLLATQQPVARDLRELVAVIKIASELERLGDYAVHLAKASIKLADEPLDGPVERILEMADNGAAMIHEACSALMARDAGAARACATRDAEIDLLHKTVVGEALELLKAQPDRAKATAKLLATASAMERLGDHVTNICESVIYAVDGSREELNH